MMVIVPRIAVVSCFSTTPFIYGIQHEDNLRAGLLLSDPAETIQAFSEHKADIALIPAICAVMLYDAKLSQEFAAKLQDEGVFVTGFYYPVVPKGQARIRVQVSAGHTIEQLDRCIAAFTKVGKELNVIK